MDSDKPDQANTPSAESSAPAPAPTAPVVSGGEPAAAPTVGSNSSAPVSGGGGKKRWLMPTVIAVAAALVLGVGYVFAFYLPNTPDNVYNKGIANTGAAIDKLVDYTKTQSKANYSSATVDGKVQVKGDVAVDATLNGAFDRQGNGTLDVKASIVGQNVTASLRTIKAKDAKTPDLYVQVSGIKSMLDAYGLGDLDGQWLVIDHATLDSYTQQFQDTLGAGAALPQTSLTAQAPTNDEAYDAIAKVQAVNKQYLFTTDSSKAVLVKQKFVGKEKMNNRNADHYVVGYNKAHLQAYVNAVKSALDGSKLNDWSKRANDGKSLSEVLDFTALNQSIADSKGTGTADLWIDTGTKLISNIEFTDPADKTSKFDIGQNFTGGGVYPLILSVKDSTTNVKLTLTVDTKTNKFSLDLTGGSGTTTFSGNFNVVPSNKSVTVTAPTGAKSLTDLFSGLSGAGL